MQTKLIFLMGDTSKLNVRLVYKNTLFSATIFFCCNLRKFRKIQQQKNAFSAALLKSKISEML